ncbi:MAG: DUF3619 family protein [Gallionella sp.]
MITNLDPGEITRLLTVSARQLDQSTLSALSSARQNALKRQAVRSPVFALNAGHGILRLIPNTPRIWAVAGLLVVMLIFGTGFWHHIQEQQIDETDVAILTDDLPIEVFVN